jgi:hypothetical protein
VVLTIETDANPTCCMTMTAAHAATLITAAPIIHAAAPRANAIRGGACAQGASVDESALPIQTTG